MPSQPSVLPPENPQKKSVSGSKRIPVLPVRDTVLFPHAVLPLTVGRESSIQLIESLGEERSIVVAAQLDPRLDAPKPTICTIVGTLATVHKVVRMPNQSRFVFTEGVERVRLLRYVQTEPFMIAEVETRRRSSNRQAPHRSKRWCATWSASSSRSSPNRPRLSDELADDRGQHRGSQPAGGLCRFLAAISYHRRQAGAA